MPPHMETQESKAQLLSELSFWEHLKEADRRLIISHSRFITYNADEIIYSPSLECLGAIIVQNGTVRSTLLSRDGKEFTLFRIRKGETCILSTSCTLSSITFDVELIAEQTCTLLVIPVEIFSALLQSNVYVENFAYKKAAERFSDVIASLERLSFMTLEQRIISFLLDESAFTHSSTLYITHEYIAKNIASSREGVTRTLNQMQKNSLLLSTKGRITLLDKSKLYDRLNAR